MGIALAVAGALPADRDIHFGAADSRIGGHAHHDAGARNPLLHGRMPGGQARTRGASGSQRIVGGVRHVAVHDAQQFVGSDGRLGPHSGIRQRRDRTRLQTQRADQGDTQDHHGKQRLEQRDAVFGTANH